MSINQCYDGDENQGDVSLSSIDYERLVDEIFDSIFAVPAEPEVEVVDENEYDDFDDLFLYPNAGLSVDG